MNKVVIIISISHRHDQHPRELLSLFHTQQSLEGSKRTSACQRNLGRYKSHYFPICFDFSYTVGGVSTSYPIDPKEEGKKVGRLDKQVYPN